MPDFVVLLRRYYDTLNQGDLSSALALFTDDAEAVTGPGCSPVAPCKGRIQIQTALQRVVNSQSRFTIVSIAASGPSVTARVELRSPVVSAAGVQRGIFNVSASFTGQKISRLNQELDLSDLQTATLANYQRQFAAGTAPAPAPTQAQGADPEAILRQFYDSLNQGDVAAAAAVFANDAEAVFPWNFGTLFCSLSACKGLAQIQRGLQATVNGATRFTVISIAPSSPSGSEVTARLEMRNRVTAQMRWSEPRGIVAVTATFVGNRITRLNHEYDLSDWQTVRVVDYQRLLNAIRADAPSTPPAAPATPFVPAWREVAPPPNGDVPNWQWIELDAPENHKLLAAVLRPPGPGPFPVIVSLHGGGGFERGALSRTVVNQEFVSAGFMVVVGCWFDGENPINPPTERPIRCPNGPAYTISYVERLKYADALVQTARVLPGADGRRVGVFGKSQGGVEAVLLGSPGTQLLAVVSDSGGYSRNFTRNDTPPVTVVQDLTAPLLMLHGTADAIIPIQDAYDMEAALRQFNKPYEAQYYDGAVHGIIDNLGNNPQYRTDATGRTIAFFKKYLMAQ